MVCNGVWCMCAIWLNARCLADINLTCWSMWERDLPLWIHRCGAPKVLIKYFKASWAKFGATMSLKWLWATKAQFMAQCPVLVPSPCGVKCTGHKEKRVIPQCVQVAYVRSTWQQTRSRDVLDYLKKVKHHKHTAHRSGSRCKGSPAREREREGGVSRFTTTQTNNSV